MPNRESRLTLAIPSKGQLEKPTMDFLQACGLGVSRPNLRQYVASMPAVPEVRVLFQRTPDILRKVDDGSVDLGITGFDIVSENHRARGDALVLNRELGYGHCRLVLAVPDSWIDVASVADVADVASRFREKGRELRISTKYPSLTRRWLLERGVFHFTIVDAEGAHEAAPAMGYAEMIVDVSSSGTTLKENRLKEVQDGTLLKSQACLVGNRKRVSRHPAKREVLRRLLERMEAHLRSRKHLSVSANIQAESPEAIADNLHRILSPAGLRGPTISRVHPPRHTDSDWYAVTLVVSEESLMETVDKLRRIGAAEISASHLTYLFDARCRTYQAFLEICRKEERSHVRTRT